MADFVHPEVLVCCDWVEQNRSKTDSIRLVESDEDILLYEQGHIARGRQARLATDLQDAVVRDYMSKGRFEELCPSRASRTRRSSFSTVTRTTGGPVMRSGCSSCSATKSAGS